MSQGRPEIRKVQVWIHGVKKDQRQVLVFKTNEKRGSFWQPVTGGVEEGEALEAAAAREAFEESGLVFSSPPRSVGFEFTFQRGGQTVREHAFEISVAEAGQPLKLDPKEHVEARWLAPIEALKLLRFESNAHPLQLLMKKWKI
jgi:dihydroneopterin triphosphate diphosphatase